MRRLRRVPLLAWILAPVAAAALIAWPLGGWDTVQLVSRELPRQDVGEVLTTHRFDIRVHDAWLTRTGHPAGYSEPDPDEVYLVVRTEVLNLTREPASSGELDEYLRPVVAGLGHDEFVPVDFVLSDDGTTLPEVNPGLARELELVWTVPATVLSEGDELRVDLYDATPRKSLISYGLSWDFELAAYIELPLEAR